MFVRVHLNGVHVADLRSSGRAAWRLCPMTGCPPWMRALRGETWDHLARARIAVLGAGERRIQTLAQAAAKQVRKGLTKWYANPAS